MLVASSRRCCICIEAPLYISAPTTPMSTVNKMDDATTISTMVNPASARRARKTLFTFLRLPK